MITATSPPKNDDALVPQGIAKQVLTAGPDHINYRGGIGSVMNVYARHFAIYKCVTSHKPTAKKWQLIPFFLKQYGRFIQTLWTDNDIRIVHLQASSHGSFYRKLVLFITAKYGFGKQVIYHMHGSRFESFYLQSDPVSKRFIRFLVEHADMVIGLSTYWQDFFAQNFQTKRLEVLGNVIHQRESKDSPLDLKPVNGPLNVLFLGAIGHRKGIFDLLDTVRLHQAAFNGRLLLRVGGNGETEQLQAYIAEHKLESLVRFEGWVSGEKKHELLSISDVYILPSYNEGLPLSILEAMNYHLPIISTPVGGTAEAVHEGINGFLVPPGDKEEIYNRLLRFIAEPDLVTQMGAASGRIVQQYQPETIFPRLRGIYESMLVKTA
ncbi:glycosyltransferase family 4 protein [Spirosoma aureum]|uniref:Glycosyltransferase family 4 protein n=1 Tax=Spirosoma aureum TaxID=2692134 RepID=A0A6G9AW40_9BACT|nr:glycosyltransferase family 4 protein [Spirosoma aureum]QIP16692.1 glycosyltransferase family 4 protein [Spirosoma aureum]